MESQLAGKLWVRREGGRAVIGLTEAAADDFGMILYVELPEPGDRIREGRPFLLVETASMEEELSAPLTGTVVEVNRQTEAQPDLIHRSPEAQGWLVTIETDGERA
ncbi:glycine cleavage system protein H [Gorillibacterium sp. sgz5001074]|uniref:glycine cleavage system protein H n=1 Tax=Gorillibacterium sp. sgz5001074 TaxID=3446695 RepID=UPI003F67697A